MGNKGSSSSPTATSPRSGIPNNETSKKKKSDDDEPRFFDFCSLSREEMKRLAEGTLEDRLASTLLASTVKPYQVLQQAPLTFWEEFVCATFLAFGVPNGAFTIPIATFLVGKFVVGNVTKTFQLLGLLLLPLALMPQPFVPSMLHSWLAHKIVRYFSFRFAYDERPPTQVHSTDKPHEECPQILVAPPHGVFPYGNILSMLVWPSMTGHHFMGLAANMALRPPIFKQILRSIGVINADRDTARQALETFPRTIGISTGGVAEVFETNREHECVLLKERVGLIVLAIRTGADLVPCYVFGNTKVLSCWSGEGIPGAHALLEKWSRKIGFALIFIHGRFGLPIPYRVPVFGVAGKPIPTAHLKCENPTSEQIEQIQGQLIDAMQDLFDRYKGMYDWGDRELIIR